MRNTLLILILILCLHSKGFAQVIEVTSNADNGAGTFREALTQAAANGTGSTDRIIFKLPGTTEADRSIQTSTALPALSSNLIIDGTTQTGAAFGVTGARVKIQCNNDINTNNDPILKGEGVEALEIYGLWIENLNVYDGSNGALVLERSGKIVIGAAGKGNYFRRNNILIDKIDEFVFQGNICFTNEFGNVGARNMIQLFGAQKVLIGGSETTGNLISGSVYIDGFSYIPTTAKQIEISYNNMGAHYDQNSADQSFATDQARILISGSSDNGQRRYDDHQILIKKNLFTACNAVTMVNIENTSGTVTIQGNAFDTNFAGTLDFSGSKSMLEEGIRVSTKAACLIGGENAGDANIIRSQLRAINNANLPEGSCKVSRNRIYCIAGKPYHIGLPTPNMPVVEISSVSGAPLQGTATRLSSVELFYDDSCDGCSPETYFATVTVGSDGKWLYNGPVNGPVIASVTLGGQTSEFTRAFLKMEELHVDNAGCGLNNGRISGIKTSSSQEVRWVNDLGEEAGNTLDIENLKPGRYKLFLGSGSCQTSSDYITVYDATPIFNDERIGKGNPSCGLSNGSVSGVFAFAEGPDMLTYAWYNQDNQKVGDAATLSGVPPGSYTLIASTPNGCSRPYGPVVLINQNGPAIDTRNISKLSSPCGGTAGFISNVIVTGTGKLSYRWLDQNNTEKTKGTVGDDRKVALNNVGPGYYRLEIKDESGCPVSISEEIEIEESSKFSIDESLAVPHDEDCSYDNGRITGMVVRGAKSVVWLDEDGKPVGDNQELSGVKAGKYHLVATNENNCTRESHVFEIRGPVRTVYALTAKVTNVSCNNDIGSVELVNNGQEEPLAYRWINESGDEAGTGPKLVAAAGVYTLYITDANQCERPYADFPIQDQTQVFSKPLVNDVKVCGAGTVAIQVSNAQPGTYYLYNSQGREIGQSSSGLFNMDLSQSGAYTIRLRDGNCESPPATFNVSIEQGALSNIANTFSPNGDGENDLWAIPGLAGNTSVIVSIFNRQGVAVYKSLGYKQPFDGKYRGTDLPIGVYYYVIDLKKTCGVLTGSLTLIR